MIRDENHPGDFEGQNPPWPEPMLGLEKRQNGRMYARFPVGKGPKDIREGEWANCDPTMWRRYEVAPYYGRAAPNMPAMTCPREVRKRGEDGRMYKNKCEEVRPPCKWVRANQPRDGSFEFEQFFQWRK